ncbi:MAG: methyltransferase domain-containing protein [Myxococcota bacterium]
MTHEEAQAVTLRWLGEAGVAPGARVLDFGCGPGHLTGLLLSCVGEGGSVVGLDNHEGFLTSARAQHAGRDVVFHTADLRGPLPQDLGSFDAVIGRRVLMYLPDPRAALERLCALLRPGGLVFVQEFVLFDTPTALPLHDRVRGWLQQMLEREGVSWQFGRELPRLFSGAGLPAPVMRAEAAVAAPGHPDTLAERIGWMVPRLVDAGIAAADIDIDSLADRLRAERDTVGQPWFGELAVAAWARTGPR